VVTEVYEELRLGSPWGVPSGTPAEFEQVMHVFGDTPAGVVKVLVEGNVNVVVVLDEVETTGAGGELTKELDLGDATEGRLELELCSVKVVVVVDVLDETGTTGAGCEVTEELELEGSGAGT
jgi:hypothetical protein